MPTPADGEWRWYNEHRLYLALDKCTDQDQVHDILDALDLILDDPLGVQTTSMRGTRDHVDRRIGVLPHGWIVVFSYYPRGVPPYGAPGLVVRDLRREFPQID